MNLVAYSVRTKGISNFARRLWTVFARFSITEGPARRSFDATVEVLRAHGAAPTYFIPAVVLGRHPRLIAAVAEAGAEIGIHGYFHNDYRTLPAAAQLEQTKRAADLFARAGIPFQGFRNPYLGWNDDALDVFRAVGFAYDSNEAVLHDVVDMAAVPEALRPGYEKSLALFQAIAPSRLAVRPRLEDGLLRLPTSIPDDEMLYDRLRMTDVARLGAIWSEVLRRVYDLGGIYVLNIHPERAVLTRNALEALLGAAEHLPLPVWIAPLRDIAAWWRERGQFHLEISPAGAQRWQVRATCTDRATILMRHARLGEGTRSQPWHGADTVVTARSFVIEAPRCPSLALSPRTPEEVAVLLAEQGYPVARVPSEQADEFALSIDEPDGLGTTREERTKRSAQLVDAVETLAAPLVRFGCWPDGARAALAITGDIDSVTIQDFFLRVLEVR